MSYGGEYIKRVLNNSTPVTDLVAIGNIYNARKVDPTATVDETINFYRLGNFDATLEYFQVDWSIDCRAKNPYIAENIATAVTTALNRVDNTIVDSKLYFGTVNILPIIPPMDEADVYNVPVNLTVRRK